MPSDDLAQRQQTPLPGFLRKPLPKVSQQDWLLQKGGASDSFRMLHLRVRSVAVAARHKAATRRRPILPDDSRQVDPFHFDGSCDCFVCGDEYDVETDAFGDGCMTYWLSMMTAKMEDGDEE